MEPMLHFDWDCEPDFTSQIVRFTLSRSFDWTRMCNWNHSFILRNFNGICSQTLITNNLIRYKNWIEDIANRLVMIWHRKEEIILTSLLLVDSMCDSILARVLSCKVENKNILLRKIKRLKITSKYLCNCSISNYACPIWGFSKSKDLERIHQNVCKIILG